MAKKSKKKKAKERASSQKELKESDEVLKRKEEDLDEQSYKLRIKASFFVFIVSHHIISIKTMQVQIIISITPIVC